MTPEVIQKLVTYFKKTFGHEGLDVKPNTARVGFAELYLGEALLGEIELDDEDDDDISYNLTMDIEIVDGETSIRSAELAKLNVFFKRAFSNDSLEVKGRPNKADSAELYLVDEFLGLIYLDGDAYSCSIAILDIDLN